MSETPRQPAFNIPLVVLVVLGLLAAVQAARDLLSEQADLSMLIRFAFVPGRLTYAIDPNVVMARLSALVSAKPDDASRSIALARVFLDDGGAKPWCLLTYAFLHGGWAHLGANSLWLVAFGTPIARRFGAWNFLLVLAVASMAGALVHWACFAFDFQPVVGASAAVSGCMGAAVRFMFTDVRTAEPAPPDTQLVPIASLRQTFSDRRALSFIAVWFLTNLAFGAGAFAFGITDAPVAWQAHIGGFVAGLLLIPWLHRARPTEPGVAADVRP